MRNSSTVVKGSHGFTAQNLFQKVLATVSSRKHIGIGIDLNAIVETTGTHFGLSLVSLFVPRSKKFLDLQVCQRILLAIGLSVFGKVSPERFDNVRPMAIASWF
jgi:hypothetical protein